MKYSNFKKVALAMFLSIASPLAVMAISNQASAASRNYSIEAMGNFAEPGVLNVNIIRPGESKVFDSDYFCEAAANFQEWKAGVNEIVVKFFSPNSDEEDDSDIEYTAMRLVFNEQ